MLESRSRFLESCKTELAKMDVRHREAGFRGMFLGAVLMLFLLVLLFLGWKGIRWLKKRCAVKVEAAACETNEKMD